MNLYPRSPVAAALALLVSLSSLHAQPQLEPLGRGVIAIHQPDGRVAVSWRLLGTDPDGVAFNLYRKSDSLPGGRGGPGFGGGRGAGPAPASDARGPAQPQRGGSGGGRGGPGGFGGDPSAPRKLNDAPLTGPTFFIDDSANLAAKTSYYVRPIVNGTEQEPSAAFTLAAGAPPLPYLSMPLQNPDGAQPGDASAADLDGDGQYDLVVKFEQRGRDNSQGGATGSSFLQGYKLDLTSDNGFTSRLLWTINLGKNIREGAHYTQFQVYDLDGDGRAEIVCKTADGTVDGQGKVIGDANANWVQPENGTAQVLAPNRDGGTILRTVNTSGHILSGPEYLTVFDGRTGAMLATTNYLPARIEGTTEFKPQALQDGWGDASGNRSDRYLACVAYLDGQRPSVILCRGYYTRTTLAAWDWRDGKFSLRWFFDSDKFGPPERTNPYRGQGNHNVSVADVDGDGRDEIIYGAMVIDDNGQPLHSTGWGHGDALHVSDLTPANPGLEVFSIQERFDKEGMNLRDARTGKPIFTIPSVAAATSGGDAGEGPGRGVAFNIDPRHPGAEFWAAGAGMSGLYNAKGERISERRPRAVNFAVWWDGDLLRELLDQNRVSKWNWESGTETTLLVAQAQTSNNGTKATPTLSADLFGDWREEIIWRTVDGRELRIYSTTIPTPHRITTLMHDPQYRVAVAWQNTAYNQPPHPSFYLDEGAPLPARAKIATTAAAK
jgi:rhamnogalacturonan endolyase